MRYSLALPAVGAALVACVSTSAQLLNPAKVYPTVCPAAIVFFSSPGRVPAEYTDVAYLSSKGSHTWTSEEGMYNSMREKAAKVGANGIIMNPAAVTDPSGADQWLMGDGASRTGKALAIYIPSDSARVREACGQTLDQREPSDDDAKGDGR